jgi:6-phosphofructokinase 1
MVETDLDFEVAKLGTCRIPSPMSRVQFVSDDAHVLFHSDLRDIEWHLGQGKRPPSFEMAGPREKIYFDPSKLKCGIVSCGGLCPGINDVIRAIVLSLFYHYGVQTVFGFRFGFEGLAHQHGHQPIELTPRGVKGIHERGGSILGSSRGPQDVEEMVDCLERMNVRLLFTLGGDGTLRGAKAIAEEILKRNLKIGVIGIPKTIDNDISFVQQSFGFSTAVSEATKAISSAHAEAEGARNGVGLVKLMGRHCGFIAAHATLAISDVNFCLVPEVPFSLDSLLQALKERLESRHHAVIVVAEGAGQDLLEASQERDPSGNIRLGDIGLFLRDRINAHFRETGMEIALKYIDPSYTIRSVPANASDSGFCLMLAHNAVHAGMAGRTNILVGHWLNEFTHVPLGAAISVRKQIHPTGKLWTGVLSSTGQPKDMFN